MLEQNDFVDYKCDLKKIVISYFERFPNLSINAMASRSSIPVSTLRRIIKSKQPIEVAPHIALNLLSYIYKETSFKALVETVPKSLKEFLLKHFGNFVFEHSNYNMDLDLNEILKDPMKYFIYKLASNSSGVSLEDVVELYGSIGNDSLKELCDLGLLEYKLGKFHAKEKNFSLDIHVMASHLPNLVKKYRPDKLTEEKNLCYSLSESLTPSSIKKIKAIQKKAVEEIFSIMNSSENWGEIPYFSLILSDKLYYQKEPGEHQ